RCASLARQRLAVQEWYKTCAAPPKVILGRADSPAGAASGPGCGGLSQLTLWRSVLQLDRGWIFSHHDPVPLREAEMCPTDADVPGAVVEAHRALAEHARRRLARAHLVRDQR